MELFSLLLITEVLRLSKNSLHDHDYFCVSLSHVSFLWVSVSRLSNTLSVRSCRVYEWFLQSFRQHGVSAILRGFSKIFLGFYFARFLTCLSTIITCIASGASATELKFLVTDSAHPTWRSCSRFRNSSNHASSVLFSHQRRTAGSYFFGQLSYSWNLEHENETCHPHPLSPTGRTGDKTVTNDSFRILRDVFMMCRSTSDLSLFVWIEFFPNYWLPLTVGLSKVCFGKQDWHFVKLKSDFRSTVPHHLVSWTGKQLEYLTTDRDSVMMSPTVSHHLTQCWHSGWFN